MPNKLPPKYIPAEHEGRVRAKWTDSRAFHADPAKVLSGEKKPYAIFIPPPNVTDRLHLGHALNNTLQDVQARAHRMMGYETLWMPGTDHAGIATQTVVEKRVLKETGRKRTDFPREEFVAKIQAFKDEYEAIITDQLKAMGCSCDWDRQRFTMDPICAKAVREAFFRLFKDGLIYRGKRLVNWDPVTQTALADDEVEMEEIDGHFYDLRYPLVHGKNSIPTGTAPGGTGFQPVMTQSADVGKSDHRPSSSATNPIPVTWDELKRRNYPGAETHPDHEQAWITVATTRPETYLGDTAVAINPKDPRAHALRGLHCELPLVGRVIPIIEDDYVVLPAAMQPDPEAAKNDPKAQFATGFLKVTPAHDPNDYEIGRRHNLAAINVMAPDASISDKHGWTDIGDAHLFVGLSREAARKKVLDEFKARAVGGYPLLADKKPYKHSVGHSYRSHAAIEPYLSDQWYVKVTDPKLAQAANRALVHDQRSHETAPGGTGFQPVMSPPGGTGFQPVRPKPPTSTTNPDPKLINALNQPNWPSFAPKSFVPHNPYPPHESSPRNLIESLRNLPHVEIKGATYFVTWKSRDTLELRASEYQVVLEALRHFDGDRIHLHAACVMSNHVHAVVTPLADQALGDWVGSVKQFSANRINAARGESGPFWQDERFDHIVRDNAWFSMFIKYVLHNAHNVGLVANPMDYPWNWVHPDVLLAFEGRIGLGLESLAAAGSPAQHRLEAGATQTGQSSDAQLRFYPDRYAKAYESWHDNIRDWCISRQLWWGHRIPVWKARSVEGYLGSDGIDPTSQLFPTLNRWVEQKRVAYILGKGVIEPAEGGFQRSEDAQFFVCVRSPDDQEVIEFLRPFGFIQEDDVLDTWFSSALWPMSTLGWPKPPKEMQGLLEAFNPSNVLCTAREIITLWVSRMVMFNRYLLGEGEGHGPLPFKDVFIHSVIQDGEGRKMSKSLGNGVNPLDIIQSHGSDAMRFTLCKMTTNTQDVRLPVVFDKEKNCNTSPKFDEGRNFVTKVFNAAKFVMMNLEEAGTLSGGTGIGGTGFQPVSAGTTDITKTIDPPQHRSQTGATTPLADRWILSRFTRLTHRVNAAIKSYDYSDYAEAMYQFLWWDFCDWYVEAIKPTVKTDSKQRAVVKAVLDASLRLLHPICPYVTEVLHEVLREYQTQPVPGLNLGQDRGQTCISDWPQPADSLIDEAAEKEVDWLRALTESIRQVRAAQQVEPKRRITLHTDAATLARVKAGGGLVETLAGLAAVEEHRLEAGATKSIFTFEGREHALTNLKDAVDPAAERKALADQIDKLDKAIAVLEGRLANPGYAERAPAKMVQETKDQLAQKTAERDAAKARMATL
jgi:valyl-tRNA synthetase